MCCDPGGATVDDPKVESLQDCPVCGGECVYNKVTGEYSSTSYCGYSPKGCDACGSRPCDDSC